MTRWLYQPAQSLLLYALVSCPASSAVTKRPLGAALEPDVEESELLQHLAVVDGATDEVTVMLSSAPVEMRHRSPGAPRLEALRNAVLDVGDDEAEKEEATRGARAALMPVASLVRDAPHVRIPAASFLQDAPHSFPDVLWLAGFALVAAMVGGLLSLWPRAGSGGDAQRQAALDMAATFRNTAVLDAAAASEAAADLAARDMPGTGLAALERSDSFRFKTPDGLVMAWLLVVASSSSDTLTKLVFQLLAQPPAALQPPVDPEAALVIFFVFVIATVSLLALLARWLLVGVPQETSMVPRYYWPCLGLIMVSQILLGALTFAFLPATVVTALNSGLVITFAAAVRFLRGKRSYDWKLTRWLAVVVAGCVGVGLQNYFDLRQSASDSRPFMGSLCVVFLALSTALAATLDDYLTKDLGLESSFLAMAQAGSASVYIFLGVLAWMCSQRATPQMILDTWSVCWIGIPWLKMAVLLALVAQISLKLLAVHVVSASSAATASMFMAVSMFFTWVGSALLSQLSLDDVRIGDTTAGWDAAVRAASMGAILCGVICASGAHQPFQKWQGAK